MKGPLKLFIGLAAVVWGSAILFGGAALLRYGGTSGASAPAPATWPSASRLARQADDTVVMFAHPFCACTNASLAELDRLLTASSKHATVVFLEPRTGDTSWRASRLVERARSIRGVTVAFDEGGLEAEIFGAQTSGHVVVYDHDGTLTYSGGITQARGHEGWAAGQQALLDLLTVAGAARSGAPTYGCALHEPQRAELVDRSKVAR